MNNLENNDQLSPLEFNDLLQMKDVERFGFEKERFCQLFIYVTFLIFDKECPTYFYFDSRR